jgi:hypothetical protein
MLERVERWNGGKRCAPLGHAQKVIIRCPQWQGCEHLKTFRDRLALRGPSNDPNGGRKKVRSARK